MIDKNLAVVLLSGGLDSCVTMAIAREKHNVALLHVGYAQRTQTREYNCFRSIARYYKVPETRTLALELDFLRKIGGSSLTDLNIPVDKGNTSRDIPTSYVPFRNTHLLSIAVSWAEVIKAESIYIGAVQQDSPDYPDCRAEYYEAFNRLVEVGTKPSTNIKVITPLLNMSKSEIVKKGIELAAPLQLTWSCYERNDKSCGYCQSCRIRLKAFEEAGFKDKIHYV
ncbi:MAG: 7-cyano-7-deazaguanine synthase QueC [Candidatus Scalindua rubra]|uniref:7-cyano-7-deazaguanine synthase n=1 Tax=Candidatus Scalindua brodae TaxID=237368 RepID=A0A0B0EHW8_9BACT|nr:MAG: PP-loop ATPase family including transcriptional regulator ExsB [Candidatus Scalindua brodae]MBZ0107282.1 7-cyano-7-deazaguanine synthase QueC [Candidatus Scalindua rubra]TWU32093.1 7-cyano-7-deazaguanine synthase [Candidatus Brocadiaceae bacterium S225]